MDLIKQKITTIWNPSGLPSLPNLLCYETFAVADYGCVSHALHLRQTRQSLNLGFNKMIFFKNQIHRPKKKGVAINTPWKLIGSYLNCFVYGQRWLSGILSESWVQALLLKNGVLFGLYFLFIHPLPQFLPRFKKR